MAFNEGEVSKLLAQCHRRCCVCHRFCGVKIELHHIQYHSDEGSDDIENAIPLCFECHAEVNHYNDAHPRGRKFTNEELQAHKKQWLDICSKYPNALISAPRDADVGPLEGMLIELEHNESIVSQFTDGSPWQDKIGCVLNDNEFKRSIAQGSMLMLPDELRKTLSNAYAGVGRINSFVSLYTNTRPEGNAFSEATDRLLSAYRKSKENVSFALSNLREFLLEEKIDKKEVNE